MEKELASHILLTGLTPLIPIPLLDEYVERRLLKTLYRRMAQAHAIDLNDAVLQILVEDHSSR